MVGARPIDTISRSKTLFCAAPWASVHSTATSSLPAPTAVIFTPVWIARPCFANAFCASFATASSAAPRNAGSASSTVTSAPSRRQTLPISRPITPAPTTPRRFGTAVIASAPALSSTRRLSNGAPGSARGTEPVATITFFAAIFAGAAPSTSTAQPSPARPAKRPRPWKNAILFFFMSHRMPSLLCETTLSLRAIIRGTSIDSPCTSIPCCANACPAWWKCSDDCSSAFDGMQPTFVQVPPGAGFPSGRVPSSMQAVEKPSCAARIAAV